MNALLIHGPQMASLTQASSVRRNLREAGVEMKRTTQRLDGQGPLERQNSARRLCLILICMGMTIVLGIYFFNTERASSAYLDTPSALFPVGVDGLYGYIDPDGRWAIHPKFEAANVFAERLRVVQLRHIRKSL